MDACPSDPGKLAEGVCGCGVLEDAADSDGDQVPNCLDLCEGNDERGDGDGDGVCDTGAVQLLLQTSEFTEARGPCAEGGSELHFGLDADASGQLEEPEIASISYVCTAAGAPAIAFSSEPLDEAPPACPKGAIALELGVDRDDDGSLEDTEVQATHVLCADLAAPVNLSPVPADESTCKQGGIELSSGVDRTGDLTIDSEERTAISRLCAGSGSFSLSLPLAASDSCPQGGVRLAGGVDGELGSALEADAIKSAVDLCAGANLLVVSTELEPGSRECPDGGTKLRAGTDRDLNGMLDASEVTASETICSNVTQPVRTAGLLPDSTACPDGGVIVSVGDITDVAGGAIAMETSYTHTACDGEHALLDFREPASNSTSCETDPVHVTIGVDRDGDGKLDAPEAASSDVVCPGTDAPVTRSREMPASPRRCPEGGVQIESGMDRDGSGTLDDSEVSSWQWSCDGNHLTVQGTALPGRSPQCKDGGVVLESGEDKDGDHIIDSDERWGSDVICGTTPLLVEVQALGLADGCLSGTRVSAGSDDGSSGGMRGDGALQSGEIRVTQQQCKGDDGCAVMVVKNGSRSAVTLLWAALGLLFALRRRRRRDNSRVARSR
jgi:MYXO-CTERM domain-containing protein